MTMVKFVDNTLTAQVGAVGRQRLQALIGQALPAALQASNIPARLACSAVGELGVLSVQPLRCRPSETSATFVFAIKEPQLAPWPLRQKDAL